MKGARSVTDENQGVNYVFAIFNCLLKAVFKDGTTDIFFKDISDLNELFEKRVIIVFYISRFLCFMFKKRCVVFPAFAVIISFL